MYLRKNIFLEDPPGVPIEILSWWIARDLLSHWAPLDFVNYARQQSVLCAAHSRLTASHFSHLGCSLLCCPVHCRPMATSASLFMQVAVHLHNQHALLLRAASRRRQHRCRIRKRCKRHNGWVIKPRQGDPSALRVEEKWWHDSSRSPYWHYFKDDASFNEHSYSGVEFYDEFHMPRKVFETLYNMFVDIPGFKDRKRGDGGRGMRSQPLRLNPRRYINRRFRRTPVRPSATTDPKFLSEY